MGEGENGLALDVDDRRQGGDVPDVGGNDELVAHVLVPLAVLDVVATAIAVLPPLVDQPAMDDVADPGLVGRGFKGGKGVADEVLVLLEVGGDEGGQGRCPGGKRAGGSRSHYVGVSWNSRMCGREWRDVDGELL